MVVHYHLESKHRATNELLKRCLVDASSSIVESEAEWSAWNWQGVGQRYKYRGILVVLPTLTPGINYGARAWVRIITITMVPPENGLCLTSLAGLDGNWLRKSPYA